VNQSKLSSKATIRMTPYLQVKFKQRNCRLVRQMAGMMMMSPLRKLMLQTSSKREKVTLFKIINLIKKSSSIGLFQLMNKYLTLLK